jgi:glutaredoxin
VAPTHGRPVGGGIRIEAPCRSCSRGGASARTWPLSCCTMSAAAEQLVDRFIDDLRWEERLLQQQPEVVEIATSPSSALCRTALMMLDDLGIAYRELQIGRDVTEAQLVRRKGGPFVLLPLIFIDDRFVGGHAELKSLAALGADAVLSAGEPTSGDSFRDSRTPPPRTASPPIFDRLHYEAESNEARRAALQRHGLEYSLHSPMSPERTPLAPRPHSPPVNPRLNSPNRELVSQERSGVGIRAVIRTDRTGMRHDSVHSAVRCGGGWELRASTSLIERAGNGAQHRSHSPAYSPRRRRRRSPGRTPAPVHRPEPEPETEPEPKTERQPRPQEEDASARLQQRLQAVGNRLAELGSGVRLGTSSALGGEVALWGLDGDIITSTPPHTAAGSGKLPLLLRLVEGACDRVEREEDSGGCARR